MKVLGVCYDVWIASAAIIEDGQVIAAAPEERFSRIKQDREFPKKAIEYCLKAANCTFKEMDYITLGWNPGNHIKRYNPRFSKTIRWRAEYLYTFPNSIFQFVDHKVVRGIESQYFFDDSRCNIIYADHHLSHAANAFFLSPYKEAAIFCSDGRGEDETGLYGIGRGNEIVRLQSVLFPNSIGLFYMAFTEYLGFLPHSDEWKVMALGAYVEHEDNPFYEKIKRTIRVTEDGQVEIDLKYFTFFLSDQLNFFSKILVEEFGPARGRDEPLEKRHYLIASALQRWTEEMLVDSLNHLHRITKLKNLVVNGGVFMNSLFNGKILRRTNFESVFIPSCPDDSGTCIGSALLAYNQKAGKQARRFTQTHNYWGPGYSDDEIKRTLDAYKIKYHLLQDPEKSAAKAIADGKIIGWFQGKMEFGQRALGNRSILCDPRDASMKDKVNSAIKYRESFRPFAPSILEEEVRNYFDIEEGVSVPFMERVYPILPEKRKVIPAVTHADGTGRLQTVHKDTNPKYHRLISEFGRITGVPVVFNTSFNLNGEPIVCSPKDAIRTFYSCGMDCLFLGKFLIEKQPH